ncbi:restriction endonuclease subunit S [Campylobacter devanensis]|uniref:restriction endonuclease subunit S n=1 Tax=Campylobacter devanensis TaxID=3161138 RepID=UPI000A331187|nr:restriction endonuclease subunit S [Campylobacter sp. P0108]
MTRAMKDSGIEWIGEIPQEWEVTKINHLYSQRNQKVSDKDFEPLSVTKKGILPQLENAAKTDNGDNRKLVKIGDFVINSRSDRRGSCGISSFDGSVSLINIVLKPRENMNSKYFDWLFHTTLFADEFYKYGNGIVDDLWSTSWDNMKNILVPYPPLNEQQKIADFLDEKCSHIDSVLEKVRASIDEYKQLKQSVITQAVTKGIRPNRPMKDSGNKYYGEIPNNWYICKTLYCLSMPITDGPHSTPELFDTGIPFVSAEAVSCGNGSIDFNHIRGYISQEFYDECCLKYIPQINDVYMIKSGATTGKVSIVDTDRIFTIWSPLAVFRCNEKKTLPKFMYYAIQSDQYQKQIALNWSFGTQQNIGMRVLESLKICVPSLDEQQEIVSYLDDKCSEIDKLITKKEQLIKELETYKKSLIYEYVTGKKEVI